MNKAEKFEYETADGLCELCRLPLGYSDDNWDGLCPECADEVSDYLDHHGLCDEDRDDAVARLTQIRQKRSRIMAAVKSKDTTPEMIVRRLVHGLGYRFRLHRRDLPGTPDIVLPRLRKVINVNGCFWHMHHCGRCRIPVSRRAYWIGKLRRNRERDISNRRKLRRLGFSAMTIWECQTRDVEKLLRQIRDFLAA